MLHDHAGACRCTDLHYLYVFEHLPDDMLEAYCKGACPSCLGICNCAVGCRH